MKVNLRIKKKTDYCVFRFAIAILTQINRHIVHYKRYLTNPITTQLLTQEIR